MKSKIARITSIVLTLVMCFGLIPAKLVFAAAPEQESKVVSFHEKITSSEITEADVLMIEYSDIASIAEDAKDMVDAGTMLYITAPETSAEDIANALSIPKTDTSLYQDAVLIAYSIYKVADDNYVFANHYAVFAEENTGNSKTAYVDDVLEEIEPEMQAPLVQQQHKSNFSQVTLLSEYNSTSIKKTEINPEEVVDNAIKSKAVTIQDMRLADLSQNSEGLSTRSVSVPVATKTWNNTLNVYGTNNTKYGYINCTVYAFARGTGTVDNSKRNIYDVVSNVKAYPNTGYKVSKYKVQIHCNITGHKNLQTTSIPSGISYSTTLKLDYSPSGYSGGGSTSWTYNPESQKITESSTQANVINWTAVPQSPTTGKAYDLAPGMRVASQTQYQRGAFSKIYCDAMIAGITINSNNIQVGGYF